MVAMAAIRTSRSGPDGVVARVTLDRPILEAHEREKNPYFATARLWDNGIIDPLDTGVLSMGLEAVVHAPIPETRFGVFRM